MNFGDEVVNGLAVARRGLPAFLNGRRPLILISASLIGGLLLGGLRVSNAVAADRLSQSALACALAGLTAAAVAALVVTGVWRFRDKPGRRPHADGLNRSSLNIVDDSRPALSDDERAAARRAVAEYDLRSGPGLMIVLAFVVLTCVAAVGGAVTEGVWTLGLPPVGVSFTYALVEAVRTLIRLSRAERLLTNPQRK